MTTPDSATESAPDSASESAFESASENGSECALNSASARESERASESATAQACDGAGDGAPDGAPLIAIVGPTGTGKSALAVNVAHTLAAHGTPAEIISADAMQLYRGMDIGTAKITPAEMRGIPHHLLDVLSPRDEATVAAYQRDARKRIREIHTRQHAPLLVGGSGLYVNATLYDLRFPGSDPAVRAELTQRHESEGLAALVSELLSLDPAAADTVDLKNPRRVIRALEVLRITGQPMAAHLPKTPRPLWPTVLIGVTENRAELVTRLDRRVEQMWEDGIVDETKALIAHGLRGGSTATHAIGYAQALAQIDGTLSQADAIAATQQLTRRYARRQMSWFRRLPGITWVTSAEAAHPDTWERIAAEWTQLTTHRPAPNSQAPNGPAPNSTAPNRTPDATP